VPASVRFPGLDLPAPLSELEALREMQRLASRNGHAGELACFAGAGCYNHYVPAAVDAMMRRGEFLTSYTPYQPEMSQGTLQFLFEFQSLSCDLLGMEVANASLYDGSSGTAEAVLMAQRLTRRDHVVLAADLHPEYRAVIETYLAARDVEVRTAAVDLVNGKLELQPAEALLDDRVACLVVQQPGYFGAIHDLARSAQLAHDVGALLVVAVPEAISLGLLKSPGSCGADIVVAEGQSLGVPMQLGGPWAAMMATRQEYVRQLPGRIVGQTVDGQGRRGFVLTLQAREQHIRREKATSNICTSQALLALGITVYLALVGPSGLRAAAGLSHQRARQLYEVISRIPSFTMLTQPPFFNELLVRCPRPAAEVRERLLEAGIIAGVDVSRDAAALADCLLLCCTELTTPEQIAELERELRQFGVAA
jgi:glycine dehydrogenase subunit 1